MHVIFAASLLRRQKNHQDSRQMMSMLCSLC